MDQCRLSVCIDWHINIIHIYHIMTTRHSTKNFLVVFLSILFLYADELSIAQVDTQQ